VNDTRTLTRGQLLAEARERFGDNPLDWAFQCPSCGDIATGHDFRAALAEHPRSHADGKAVTASDLLGQECIGRTLGALDGPADAWKGRGCDWTAYGLIRGPWIVDVGDGKTGTCFPLAPLGHRATALRTKGA
jgi:hypothetical protein